MNEKEAKDKAEGVLYNLRHNWRDQMKGLTGFFLAESQPGRELTECDRLRNELSIEMTKPQPGRGLTADDVNEAFKRKDAVNNHIDWIDSCVFVAAELNKIRAPKADDVRLIKGYTPIEWDGLKKCCSDWEKQSNSQMDMRQKAETERDELKSMNEKLRVDIRCADDAKAALQTAYNELKAHPAGVTKEQVKAAARLWDSGWCITDEAATCIASALSPKWIKCSDRMPEYGKPINFYRQG